MELFKDDRVRMPTKPEWGLGRVIGDPAVGKVSVHFREAGEKILSLKHAKVVRLEGEAARDLWLDSMSFEPPLRRVRYVGPREAIEAFLARYPGGFRGQRFVEEMRQPKLDAHEFTKDQLDREATRELIEAEDFGEICQRALELVRKTNAVYPVERAALTRALRDEEHRARFARSLGDLLYGEDAAAVRFKRFAAALEEIEAARWTVATYFTFIRFPGEHMLLKPTFTQNAAALCRFDLHYRPEPNRATYERLLEFARILEATLTELQPADMFDLQGFIWSLAQAKD